MWRRMPGSRTLFSPFKQFLALFQRKFAPNIFFTIKFHRGDLFAGTPYESETAQIRHLQRAPMVLDANLGAVITALEAAERQNA